ncbi:MAG: glutamate--tRNA ligase, partial [Proteobacteria bacterium]|nr:glutamate--tRNA ligase [Pseudomonadota bacterium]
PIAEIGALVKKELQETELWDDAYDTDKKEWYLQTIDMIRDRFHTLKDFTTLGRAYFADDFDIEEAALTKNLLKYPELKNWLPMLADRFESLSEFTKESAEQAAREFAEEIGVKPGIPINASRAVITGLVKGPSMFELFIHLGREKVVARLRDVAKYFE